MASPRRGRGGRPSLSLSADTSGQSGDRLAMVWTVEASDGTEERRGTGEDGGGILRPGSLSSCFVCSFALPYPHHLREGKRDGEEDEAGRMTDSPRRCPAVCWLLVDRLRGGGDSIAQNRTGWLPFISLWLLVRRWRCGERLAMVWTVKTSDGAEERRGTGEEVGGILRPGSLSSFPSSCSFALPYPHHLKEENEDGDEAGRMADCRGAAISFFLLLFFLYI